MKLARGTKRLGKGWTKAPSFCALEQQFGSVANPSVQSREAELLVRISGGPSEAVWRRDHELSAKRDAETLSPEEHKALFDLSEAIEAADVNRLEQMIELAKLRGVDLRTVRTQLGISPSTVSNGLDNA